MHVPVVFWSLLAASLLTALFLSHVQGVDLSKLPIKEVNQKDLTYVPAAAREAATNVRSALGSEYAGVYAGLEYAGVYAGSEYAGVYEGWEYAGVYVALEYAGVYAGPEYAGVYAGSACLPACLPALTALALPALQTHTVLPASQNCSSAKCVCVSCAVLAAKLRAEAKPFEGDRLAKRKHQIGTLFYNARMKELEMMVGGLLPCNF